MDKATRDRFLTEAMDLCWHEAKPNCLDNSCIKCFTNLPFDPSKRNINFSTWEGFGNLFVWAKAQAWWFAFMVCFGETECSIYTNYINPDEFADIVYEYLQENKP